MPLGCMYCLTVGPQNLRKKIVKPFKNLLLGLLPDLLKSSFSDSESEKLYSASLEENPSKACFSDYESEKLSSVSLEENPSKTCFSDSESEKLNSVSLEEKPSKTSFSDSLQPLRTSSRIIREAAF